MSDFWTGFIAGAFGVQFEQAREDLVAHLVGPEAIQNGEIYSAANDREQAAIVFKVAAQIVRADPELEAMLKIVDSTKTIVCYGNGSVYRAISAEAGTKHGLNPSVVIYDELAQAKNRALYDVLDTAMGAREEPLFVTISTQSNDPQHILSQLIDDGQRADDPSTVTHLYAVPDDVEDIFDEAEWLKANPALGDFRSLEDMRAQASRAARMPSFEAAFRNLYLNQRVDAQSPLRSALVEGWPVNRSPDTSSGLFGGSGEDTVGGGRYSREYEEGLRGGDTSGEGDGADPTPRLRMTLAPDVELVVEVQATTCANGAPVVRRRCYRARDLRVCRTFVPITSPSSKRALWAEPRVDFDEFHTTAPTRGE